MHPFATILRELGSHLSQLEVYVRKHPTMDTDSIDIAVGLPMESIWLTLRDEIVLERVFGHARYCIACTVLLTRIYTILQLMYLPSRFITPNTSLYGNKVVRRIEGLLKEYGWQT